MAEKESAHFNEKIPACFMFIFPFLFGGFHVFTSCAAGIFLTAYFISEAKKNRKFSLNINLVSCAVIIFVISYLVTALWAVDRGTALLGFIKFFPLIPFLLIVIQLDGEQKKTVLKAVPFSGVAMTVISFALHYIGPLEDFFTVYGRLSGFFQYPNTFAAFLVCGVVIAVRYFKDLRLMIPFAAVLIFGVLESGSRMAFAVLAVSVVLLLITHKNKKISIALAGVAATAVVSAVVYVVISGNYHTVGRFLTTSISESTFVGRLLYWKDSLAIIAKHPFGLGYLGYYFVQHEYQTGVYTVMYVHNELLQIMLDIGWIPALLILAMTAKSLLSRNTDACSKILLTAVCLHALFDFDFQYIVMLFIVLLCLDYQGGYTYEIGYKKIAGPAILVAVTLLGIYFASVDFCYFAKKYDAAVRLYPGHTLSLEGMISEEDSSEEQYGTAVKIEKNNKYISVAYYSIADHYLSEGDIEKYISYCETGTELYPYGMKGINRYGETLVQLYYRYIQVNDFSSAEYCAKKLLALQNRVNETKENTSSLAWKVENTPSFKLSESVTEFINLYEEQKTQS